MNREELSALRDVLDALLRCPDHVRELLVRWLTPEAAQKPGNGLDPHPPPIATTRKASETDGSQEDLNPESFGFPPPPRQAAPPPYAGKARRGKPPSGKAAERKLLEAMRESPGLSVAALAKAAGGGRSATGERLRQLAARGAIDKDADGRWRLAGDEARPMEASPS